MTKTFDKAYLMNELRLPYEAIRDNIVGDGRWSIFHEIVFKDKDGKHYKADYSVGATECQDESPWEYDEQIECTEVEPKEITIMDWVPVEG